MDEAMEVGQVSLSFTFRGRSIHLSIGANSTVSQLGKELQSLTGVDPSTLKLLLPQGKALIVFSDENAGIKIQDCGIQEGRTIRMMGATSEELAEVSKASQSQRIIGFEEEERRARQRMAPVVGGVKLPQGPYVFANFKTLQMPGVKMTPSPAKALELMHGLASDPGIVAIMNKHKWRVGMMSEMAPEGLVGISPKCLLGLNKNHGEEISLRLRTDDLKGFRKYESIKKTLLHELAHMVYGEHDDNFYRLDRQLNKEAVQLDWTRSQKNTLSSGVNHYRWDDLEDSTHSSEVHRLGGSFSGNVKVAVANAALNRWKARENEQRLIVTTEPDPDDQSEPDPDDKLASDDKREPDPDDNEAGNKVVTEPDPDDEADERSLTVAAEPDPDNKEEKYARKTELVVEDDRVEPGKGDASMEMQPRGGKKEGEPDPDDGENEPDPDDSTGMEPDPDDEMDVDVDTQAGLEETSLSVLQLDGELERIQVAAEAANKRLQQLIEKLRFQANTEAMIAFRTLLTILSNVMEHPNEEKYKRLKMSNPVFHQRVGKFEGAVELLKLVGFSEEAKEFYVLKHSDPGLLWLARSSLEAAA